MGNLFFLIVLSLLLLPLSGCSSGDRLKPPQTFHYASLSPELAQKVLSLNPDAISEHEVHEVLSRCPAPRILALDGSIRIVTMESFSRFLVAMGYPESQVRNPLEGSYSYSSYLDSTQLAGMLAWYYEQEGLRPILIGHSQGGMLTVKLLHELAGTFHKEIRVWNPQSKTVEERITIKDPLTGQNRPVVGLRLGYASAVGTGKGMRRLLLQWDMLKHLRNIPDSTDEFTGFHLQTDLISGTLLGVHETDLYKTIGSSRVRNITLPKECSHLGIPSTEHLATQKAAREWIYHYRPGSGPRIEGPPGMDKNIVFAAEVWYSIRKHWCLDLQKLIRARGLNQDRNPRAW